MLCNSARMKKKLGQMAQAEIEMFESTRVNSGITNICNHNLLPDNSQWPLDKYIKTQSRITNNLFTLADHGRGHPLINLGQPMVSKGGGGCSTLFGWQQYYKPSDS